MSDISKPAKDMTDEELLAEYHFESIASERCASAQEVKESAEALRTLSAEILARMGK